MNHCFVFHLSTALRALRLDDIPAWGVQALLLNLASVHTLL